jgi:sugar lactone lactonase YvrE
MQRSFISVLGLALFLSAGILLAHPGSGIVVDRQGNVYFVDTGSGVWKIDRDGKLEKLSAPAYHWMTIDVDSRLASVTLPHFSHGDATMTRDPGDPRIIVSSDFPVAIAPDGSLYYPWAGSGEQVQIFRLSPSGKTTVVKILPAARSRSGEMRWRNGITVSADGSIYYSEDRAIRRITPQGEVTTVISNLSLPGCGSIVGVEPELGAYCRGLAVDTTGTVFVAATGCRAVLKITPDKKVTTVLQASTPWSPTAVALFCTDLYVLEYLHTAGDNRREWLPRVRKVFSDGRVVTVATLDR